jgi:hypothetical protein
MFPSQGGFSLNKDSFLVILAAILIVFLIVFAWTLIGAGILWAINALFGAGIVITAAKSFAAGFLLAVLAAFLTK